jgi:PleD family two-component response regulator
VRSTHRLHAIARANRKQSQPAVVFVDLDGFKDVNDVHGQDARDRFLAELGSLKIHRGFVRHVARKPPTPRSCVRSSRRLAA